jgi:RNA polymerase sigma-70 factor, ECF subfamily
VSRSEQPEAAFLADLAPELRPMFEGWAELGEALGLVLAESRQRWPNVAGDDGAFARYLAERAAPSGERPELPPHAADLYLAWACLAGDAAALAHFDRAILDRTNRVLVRLGLSAADAEDVKQELRARLLLPDDGAAPRLASYQGTGPLVSWACAVAGRQALGALRRRPPVAELDEDFLAATDDPYLAALRDRHRSEFKAAFQAALAALEARDRAVLRALLVDERSVGDIALVYGIHRVTASRWMARIRRSLLTDTRERLRSALDLSDTDLDSAMRLVDSQLDLSIHRLLAE